MLTDHEIDLILLCARQDFSAEMSEQAAALLRQRPLNWRDVTEESWRHGVAPLLFRNLQPFLLTEPALREPLDLLRQAYVRSAFRARIHDEAIQEIAPAFARSEIPLVLLKGAALGKTVYRDPAVRPFADIDLLVREKDVDRARTLLMAAGFQLAPALFSERINRKYHVNLPFVRQTPSPVHIELHWKLSDPFRPVSFDEALLIERSLAIPIGQSSVRVLDSADALIYLAAHLHAHGYLNAVLAERPKDWRFLFRALSGNRLIWFTDLRELINQRIDWDEVRVRMKAANAAEALSVSLGLLRPLYGMELEGSGLGPIESKALPWSRRLLAHYVVSLPPASRQGAWFRKSFLSTQNGFELRLIRLLDLWQYIFSSERSETGGYWRHVSNAILRCGGMAIELLLTHIRHFVRARGTT